MSLYTGYAIWRIFVQDIGMVSAKMQLAGSPSGKVPIVAEQVRVVVRCSHELLKRIVMSKRRPVVDRQL